MARLARVVLPGIPHHVTQRGNRRQRTFFSDADYQFYRALMAEWCERCEVAVWCYCLMPNHVHLIVVPQSADGLRRAIGEAHRRYSRHVNFREGWRGHLWQDRFASCAMDETHLLAAARYVELNPVRAALVSEAGDWPWSSAAARLAGMDDALAQVGSLLAMEPRWAEFLSGGFGAEAWAALRRGERTGRPVGSAEFLAEAETTLGRCLSPQRPGRKRKVRAK